jgi:hypothetical protein
MLDQHAKKSRGRCLSSLGGTALLGAVLALGSASTAFAQAASCPVTFAVSNATTIAALQFESTISPAAAALGDFTGCTASTSGILDFNTAGNTLEVGWAADGGPFTGPGTFVTCNFNAPGGVPALVPADFSAIATLDCTKQTIPTLELCAPAPTYAVAIGTCSVCGNGIVESGEQCEGPDPRCNALTCTLNGNCTPTPLAGCKTGAALKSKLQFKDKLGGFVDNTKDSGQYAWGAGAATTLSEFKDPVNTAGVAYRLCVYDANGLVSANEVPSQGTCDGAPCWKASGTKGFQYKSKSATVDGVAQVKLTSGDAGKAKASIKMKSKTGTYVAPPLGLTEPGVKAQLIIDDGGAPVCFETTFPAAAKNDASQYSAKGP